MKLAQEIALLLAYPPDDAAELHAAVRSRAAGTRGSAAAAVTAYLDETEAVPLGELRRLYVATFDFDRSASLYLTYHLYGDERRRGQALIELKARLAAAGLRLAGGELPDYLPVLLELVALGPRGEGARLLADLREPLELIRARLRELGRPEARLLDAVVVQLPRLTARQERRIGELAMAGPPTELVGLEPYPAASGVEA